MSESKVLLSVTARSEGVEIKIHEEAYGNLALVGVVEKIKLALITEQNMSTEGSDDNPTNQNYDA
jgi:hypothetical protein